LFFAGRLRECPSHLCGMPLVHQFCSGLSTNADFLGVTGSGVVPGLQVGDMRGALEISVFAHLRKGGVLFVDSGAFPAFMGGGRPVDFDVVLGHYEKLAEAASCKANLFIVAPDKIGDPVETERLLTNYAPRLRALAVLGVSVLVPVQAGSADMLANWTRLTELLKGVRVIPAMPMRAAAVSVESVVSFLRCASVPQVHLLGTSRRSTLSTIDLFLPGLVVTADANMVRPAVGVGRPVTEGYRKEVAVQCDEVWYEGGGKEDCGTEFIHNAINTPGTLSKSEEDQVAKWLAPWFPRRDVEAALSAGSLEELAGDEFTSMMCDELFMPFHEQRVARSVGPSMRRKALTAHFNEKRRVLPMDGLFAAAA
jgi:hypothetical protein